MFPDHVPAAIAAIAASRFAACSGCHFLLAVHHSPRPSSSSVPIEANDGTATSLCPSPAQHPFDNRTFEVLAVERAARRCPR